jgi:AraC-like DNA-binding protein
MQHNSVRRPPAWEPSASSARAPSRKGRNGMMKRNPPVLECIMRDPGQSFRYREHGFSFEKTRWNYHPEYELQLIVETSGTALVGDSVREFGPGYLALIGPDLPHDFLSDIPPGTEVPRRSCVIQFGDALLGPLKMLPEAAGIFHMLEDSRRGIEFGPNIAKRAAHYFAIIAADTDILRLTALLELLAILASTDETLLLSTQGYQAQPDPHANKLINDAMSYVRNELGSDIRLTVAARQACMSDASFSRFFKRNTGKNFVDYVNSIRVADACKLLRNTDEAITDICFKVGYRNISNFNRHFLLEKKMTPSAYRSRANDNLIGVLLKER